MPFGIYRSHLSTFGDANKTACTQRYQKIHFESAKQLRRNTDILLTKPNKGAGVVILSRADYIDKCYFG